MIPMPHCSLCSLLLRYRPRVTFGPDADFLYGHCIFTGAAGSSFALADELAVAARSEMMQNSMPPRVEAIQGYEVQYWEDMIEGTGDSYYVYPENDTTVNVWDYKQCAEVRCIDGHSSWRQNLAITPLSNNNAALHATRLLDLLHNCDGFFRSPATAPASPPPAHSLIISSASNNFADSHLMCRLTASSSSRVSRGSTSRASLSPKR